jgi:16S rRNA C967 or C1407 C5-methylase (RsmB/RsmF family)
MKPRVGNPAGTLSGRAAALLAVRDVFEQRGQVQETLRALRAEGRLAGREGALAMDIALGAVRHVVTIGQVLSAVARVDPRLVSPALRALLWTAAYQIIWMDRIPLFAAVDQTVELAHATLGRRAAGMVNAVLRRLTGRVAERGTPWRRLAPDQVRVGWSRACAFSQPVLPAAESEHDLPVHLAAASGERRTRFRALVDRFGLKLAEAVAWASSAKPVLVLQRNPLRIDAAGLAAAAAAQWGPQVELSEGALFATNATGVLESRLFTQGQIYVQDQTAHRAATLLEPRAGERILDLCAAPGGKSIALACEMGDRGEIVACDSSAERLRQVCENIERLGLSSIHTHLLAAGNAGKPSEGKRLYQYPSHQAGGHGTPSRADPVLGEPGSGPSLGATGSDPSLGVTGSDVSLGATGSDASLGATGSVTRSEASKSAARRAVQEARHAREADREVLERPFDAALVDVPCSNSGVIARRPEARLRLTRSKIAALVRVQAELLRRAAAAVRPGGRLVYSTCSIEPEENERVVSAFLAERTDWTLEHEEIALPNWGPRPSDWRDGGYAALLRRTR